MISKIRSQERFNKQIELFYKKDSSYKTTGGGIAALILLIIAFAFVIPLIQTVVNIVMRKIIYFNMKTQVHNKKISFEKKTDIFLKGVHIFFIQPN